MHRLAVKPSSAVAEANKAEIRRGKIEALCLAYGPARIAVAIEL